ncbi:cytokinin riboside 5'-monophosphate phosphoribohydrolase LOG5-like protein isoform X4 [Tanacetum coccineum]
MEATKSRFKSVCVFCGSSAGKRDCYRDAALDLGQELVKGNLESGLWVREGVGLDGIGFNKNSQWTLMCKELTGETIGEVKAVSNMHERKAEMARHSDCFIALPAKDLVQELEDYVPMHDGVVAKARWEAEQVELNASLHSELAR